MACAYLGLGGNLGDRAAALREALTKLEAAGIRITALSSVYETEPVGLRDQPCFLNMVCAIETDQTPFDLLVTLQNIESAMGRVRTVRWGPRIIDLDILLYDEITLNTPYLTIPHPRMIERAFVLRPLAEISPDLIHPGMGLTIETLVQHLSGPERIYRIGRLEEILRQTVAPPMRPTKEEDRR